MDRDDDIGTAYVAHCDSIEILEAKSHIETVSPDAIEPAPYAVREFDREGNCGYIARVRNDGWTGSFPVVRPVDGTEAFEVVEGHKRLWVAEQAGLTTHPVEIVDVDDWELARRFVVDHLPDEEQVHDDGTATGCYDDARSRALSTGSPTNGASGRLPSRRSSSMPTDSGSISTVTLPSKRDSWVTRPMTQMTRRPMPTSKSPLTTTRCQSYRQQERKYSLPSPSMVSSPVPS